MPKKFRIVLFSNESSSAKEFGFSRFNIVSLVVLCFLLFAAITTISVNIISDLVYSHNINLLRQERSAINNELETLRKESEELNNRIEALFESDDELRLSVDMVEADQSIRLAGVGGDPEVNLSKTEFFFSEQELLGNTMRKLQKLRNQVIAEEKSYAQIYDGLNNQNEMIRYYPSIRPIIGGRDTDGFGYRQDPFDPSKQDWHDGLDISVPEGTPVYATADGEIAQIVNNGGRDGLGRYIRIDHKSSVYGYQTRYGHLSRIADGIRVGKQVKRWDVIGYVGKTGRAKGYHLHYELAFYGRRVDPYIQNYNAATFSRKARSK